MTEEEEQKTIVEIRELVVKKLKESIEQDNTNDAL
ncbi:hypothetical protein LCGC14_1994530, partial [marine sediment metagenome]